MVGGWFARKRLGADARRLMVPRMTMPMDPVRAEFQDAVQDLRMQVDRTTVLQARAALLGEAIRLRKALRQYGGSRVGLCGGDPVSPIAAQAFNERIDGLLNWCYQYTDDLEGAGHGLGDMARAYGYTEDEIVASFSVGDTPR